MKEAFFVRTPMSRDEFIRLYHGGGSLVACAKALGLTDEEMGVALLQAQYEKAERRRMARTLAEAIPAVDKAVRQDSKIWCDQCERRVCSAEFSACTSRFCKAKVAHENIHNHAAGFAGSILADESQARA